MSQPAIIDGPEDSKDLPRGTCFGVGCGLVVVGNVTWLIEFAQLGGLKDVD